MSTLSNTSPIEETAKYFCNCKLANKCLQHTVCCRLYVLTYLYFLILFKHLSFTQCRLGWVSQKCFINVLLTYLFNTGNEYNVEAQAHGNHEADFYRLDAIPVT